MKTIFFKIEFDDTNGYKGHGDDTVELIKYIIESEIEIGLEHDSVIKPGWKVTQVNSEENSFSTKDYTIKYHPPLEDQKNVLWIENSEGEGTTIDLDLIFRDHM